MKCCTGSGAYTREMLHTWRFKTQLHSTGSHQVEGTASHCRPSSKHRVSEKYPGGTAARLPLRAGPQQKLIFYYYYCMCVWRSEAISESVLSLHLLIVPGLKLGLSGGTDGGAVRH